MHLHTIPIIAIQTWRIDFHVSDRSKPAMSMLSVSVFACLLLGAASCVPPDCDRPDPGTCVNACCKLQFKFKQNDTPEVLVNKIAAIIKTGGPDSRYMAVENNTVQPWNSATSFVVQAEHATAKKLYTDSMHFAATTDKAGDTILLAFSHSQDFIDGNFAYGDHGQNYKNIVTLVKALGMKFEESTLMGCPKATN
jgi:hypothetical protein